MLKEELKQRNLTLAGKKAELIERLETDDVKRSSPLPEKARRLTDPHGRSPLLHRSATPQQSSSLSADESTVLSKFTVAELQSELRKRGLSPVGRKEELVARLSLAGGEVVGMVEELTPKVAKPKSPLSTNSI